MRLEISYAVAFLRQVKEERYSKDATTYIKKSLEALTYLQTMRNWININPKFNKTSFFT